MLNSTPDNQSKYSKSSTHLDRKIPLASDASNLLSDYLDTICIQFARRNVAEPYSITAEFEEMIINELAELNSKHKLTTDVVVKIIEKIGEPKKVVKNYIKENNPTRVKIFEDPMINTGKIKGIDRKLTARREGDVKDAVFSLIGIITYGIVFAFLTKFILVTSFLTIETGNYYNYVNYNFSNIIVANILLLLIELVSALTGETFIGVKPAKLARGLFFKLEFFFFSVFYIRLNRVIREYNVYIDINTAIIFALVIFTIIQIRDYLPFIYPLYSEPEFTNNINGKNALLVMGLLIFYTAFLFASYSDALFFALTGTIIMATGIFTQINKLHWTSWYAFIIYLTIYGFTYIIIVYPYFQ